jgi:hypothetical protein
MPNAAVLYQLSCQAQYERDGLQRALSQVRRQAGSLEAVADDLATVSVALAAKGEVRTNAAVRPYLIHIASPEGATTTSYLQAFNTSTASVTLGTTAPELQARIPAGTSQTLMFFPGNAATFPTAMSWAVTIAVSGQTAANATNTPTVTMLYK